MLVTVVVALLLLLVLVTLSSPLPPAAPLLLLLAIDKHFDAAQSNFPVYVPYALRDKALRKSRNKTIALTQELMQEAYAAYEHEVVTSF